MKDSIKITSKLSEWTVIQQKDGLGKLQLQGVFSLSDDKNYPVVKAVDIKNEKTVVYTKVQTQKDFWSVELVLPIGAYRIETGIALKSSDYNPKYLGYGDNLRNIFIGENFVIAGQSNAQGYGREEIEDMPLYGVSMYNSGWSIASHPLGHIDDASNLDFLNSGHSAWINFGKLVLKNTASPAGLIPAALNGSSIDMWASDGELYKNLIMLLKKTSARHLIWYQGCSDVFSNKPDFYEEKLNALIDSLKKDFADLKIYLIQISGTTNINNPDFGWRKIREIQRSTAVKYQLPLIVTYDLTDFSDDIHIGSRDNITLSERLFDCYKNNQSAKEIALTKNGREIIIEFKGYKELLKSTIYNISLLNEDNKEVSFKATKDNNKIIIVSEEEIRFISLPFQKLYEGRTLRDIEAKPIEYFYIDTKSYAEMH